MSNVPFYKDGLKFSCKRCSACCRYETGFVYLSKEDIERLALETKMDYSLFIKTYCRETEDWQGRAVISLKEKSNNDCIFWDEGCKVYAARPLQCITFPFWESILSSAEAWKTAASGCPGMNSGRLWRAEEIEECINKRSAQPIIKGITEESSTN